MPGLARNVQLYPWFRAASDGHAWITVFFLYMSQSLPLDQVIELSAVYYLSVFLLIDMLVAASSGLRPLSPTGIIASLLSSRMKFVPTPHLPKRFAWSMGASLALILVTLSLTGSADTWVSLVLVIFFTLAWLDAVMGFCMGCWIYSRLFDCQSCRLD